MFLVREIWTWLLGLIFIFSPGARTAVGRITRDVWSTARYTAIVLWEDIAVPAMTWTMFVLAAVIFSAFVGIWWRPALLFAPVLAAVWFLLIRGGLNAAVTAIKTANEAVLEPLIREIKGLATAGGQTATGTQATAIPTQEIEEARTALVEGLQAGVRPISWAALIAALAGIKFIVFPGIGGLMILFVFFVIIALNLVGSLLGRKTQLPARSAQFFTIIAIVAFICDIPLRATPVGAAAHDVYGFVNRKSAAALTRIGIGVKKDAIVEERKAGLSNEFNRPFRSSLYEDFWKQKPRIFKKDGTEISIGSQGYLDLVAVFEVKPFVVIKDESNLPQSIKEGAGQAIDYVLIQADPADPSLQYWVPSRCIDWKSETRLSAAGQELRSAVGTKQAEIKERELDDFKDETKVPKLWRVSKNAIVWDENGEEKGKLMAGTLAYLIEEVIVRPIKMPPVPGKLLKIRLYDKPGEVYIIRALDGEEVANPFPMAR